MSEHRTSEFGTAMSALIAVVILIAAVYALTAARFAAMNAGPGTPEEIAARLAPIGKVTLMGDAPAAPAVAAAPAAVADEGPGAAIFQKACNVCHGTGIAGAPKLGDKAAWEPRVAQGLDALLTTAINGKGAMPPRGTCAACTDEDLKVAIDYMLTKVGYEAEAPAPATPEPAPEAAQTGMSGMEGMSGMSGMEGTSGMSGMGGMSGMSGMEGMSGMSGMEGMSGMSGMEGMSGMSGMEGMSGESAPVDEPEAAAPAGN